MRQSDRDGARARGSPVDDSAASARTPASRRPRSEPDARCAFPASDRRRAGRAPAEARRPQPRPTRPRSTRCRPAPRCSSCSAAPAPAAASCSTTTRSTAGRHPDSDIFLDDVTVSRRHAEFRRDGGRLHRARRRQPQRHLRQPRPDRRGRAARAATRCRSASSAWSSSPSHSGSGVSRADERRRPPRRGARLSIGEVLGQLRADFPDVTISKIRFLEAEGLVEPRADAVGYRKFSHRRRRAAALRPARAARPLPAAAR